MSFPTTERIPGVPISLGESINVPVSSLRTLRELSPVRRYGHGRSTSECGAGHLFKSRLPPAVANVPADHIRGYVHSKRVNNYLVGNTLGEGSFAKVKEAFHILVGEKVAMKVIDKKKAQQDPYVAKNFRREARLLQMVRHPNILHLMEVIETDTSFYLITELCSGGELMKHIYSKGRLDETETRKYMRQIISAVDHLHRAGIIHRDLKVENMLLDANMDIRIIDFGLSNEEYIQGETGKVHCSTQCGSPAYAAPELLGHKEYGPEVDIWSIGVNMFAMLTGCLPYTVEPFNITALHAKMLENKMNPIPDNLSPNCKALLRRLLEANPEKRIKMDEIMSHPWINHGHTLPFGPAPFPNTLMMNDVNSDIVDHMVHVLKVGQTNEELEQELITNKATSSACVYFLLVARLSRYQRKYPTRKTRVRHKSNRPSQDQGYFEDGDDDDDSKSTASVPASRKLSRHSRPTYVPLREKRGREGHADRNIISHPPLKEQTESPPDSGKPIFSHTRRKTLPPSILEDELKRFHESKTAAVQAQPRSRTLPRNRAGEPKHLPQPDHKPHVIVDEHDPPYEFDYPEIGFSPVRTPHKGMSRNLSQGHALNQLRQDLKDKLHPPQTAWRSNPSSRVQSRNPSRHGSRVPSTTSTRNSSMQSGLEDLDDDEELIFHPVKTSTLPKNFHVPTTNNDNSTHLPSLNSTHHPPSSYHPPPTRAGRSTSQPHRKNGLNATNGDYFEVYTDRKVEEILTEILRVASNLKMRESELMGNTLSCHWKGIKFNVTVSKEHAQFGVCQIKFKRFSGGDVTTYHDLCDKFVKKLKLI